ncbi:hypothetical protein [Allonocardiopsis opalescens]|uniref:Uncharacterized protein n=1 Tax=Allonocardiopsis opalescens TaxID=1144618 RepID=A0A2T0Q0P0_9ACTN|nr:hypothetical protein [Allonocardiopsis opalescens]PRX97243.1 hypothetical protein CLV72_106279 [Allonocardiopsis opalescens]
MSHYPDQPGEGDHRYQDPAGYPYGHPGPLPGGPPPDGHYWTNAPGSPYTADSADFADPAYLERLAAGQGDPTDHPTDPEMPAFTAAAWPEPPLLRIGDISVSREYVATPAGTVPLAGTNWIVNDLTFTRYRVSAAGIVLSVAMVFVISVFSLLFLLMREQVVRGHIQVTVHGNGLYHTTAVPITAAHEIGYVLGQVNQARTMAG